MIPSDSVGGVNVSEPDSSATSSQFEIKCLGFGSNDFKLIGTKVVTSILCTISVFSTRFSLLV